MDYCKYIDNIYKNPKAITPQITVRQYYELKEHINHCEKCSKKVDEVLAKDNEGYHEDQNLN